MDDLHDRLSHVLWIGGGTDAGKTCVANNLGANCRMPVYRYDRTDLRHHRRLALTYSRHAGFLDGSMNERWVHPSPNELAERSWQSFQDRFPLVIDDLITLRFPQDMYVVAEGFGLTPELVAPCLRTPRQAIWLVPSRAFKRASVERRHKGKFGRSGE